MVQANLNALYDNFESCKTLAYADLSTTLVLATNETADIDRDTLNALCAEAKLVLANGHVSVIASTTEVRLFLKDPTEQNDALICLCTLQADIAQFLLTARRCLAEIAVGGDST